MLSTLSFLALAAIAPLGDRAPAQITARPDLQAALDAWRAAQGASWTCAQDPETGWAQMLYGGHTGASANAPRTDAEFVELALAAIPTTAGFHGLDPATLAFQDTHFLPLGLIGSGDKQSVRFRQAVQGVPVEGAFLNLLFSARGELLSVQSSALPGAGSIGTTPAIDAGDASAFARAHFLAATHFDAGTSGTPQLLIAQISAHGQRTGHLAWKVECGSSMAGAEPLRKLVYVDAHSGALLRMDEGVQHFDVFGSTNSMATPGTLPDLPTNLPASQTLKYLRCTSGSTIVYSDASGNFNFPGMGGSPNVSFGYVGTYASVFNSAGANYSLSQALPSGTQNTVLLNPTSLATVTAQANAYVVATMMRDWIRGLDPNDAHGDFVTVANVAVGGSCNAYYNGSSINFFPDGSGCSNSAYSTVISHEQGHWMNDLYSTGNGGDGMGEGNADTWSMYIWDNPVIAENFYNNGGFIRTGLNTRQFCGDSHPACYGEVHADGEVWMGAAWKIRANLNTTLGNTQGDLTSNEIFLGWMNAYNQSQIKSIIEAQWITLDDDDGILQNGSPHFTDIDNGFRAQGFPGLTACPLMANVCQNTPNSTGLGAVMTSTGQNRITTNNLVLYAINLPADKLGLFFFGQNQALVPFGNGWRCVGNPITRGPVSSSNLLGDLSWHPDLNALPGGLQIHAGETWYFQAWYRDPAAGGANFNTSDALMVPWCP